MKTGTALTVSFIIHRPIFCDLRKTSDILGNLREKWKRCRTSSVIRLIRQIEHRQSMRGISSEIRFIRQIEHRRRSRLIFGNPTNSTNRRSSITFKHLRENPSNSEKSSTPKEMMLTAIELISRVMS